MSSLLTTPRVAVIGTGPAGAACAAGLRDAGFAVSLFEKSRGVGGRMATRRVQWTNDQGAVVEAAFDHGATHFTARHPRFRAMTQRAQTAGVLAPWRAKLHAAWPAAPAATGFVAVPDMPALCRHLLNGLPVNLGHTVQRLQRSAEGWQVVAVGGEVSGPFDQVVLALPPAQAAVLLAGHHDAWADALAATPMQACWTLMAATAEVDWPWDAVLPDRGPLARVVRNDRKPGRAAPTGVATWVAQATPEWTQAHLDDEPAAVAQALNAALSALMPGGRAVPRLHSSVHRWRYAHPVVPASRGSECWWDAPLGLGVCGDFLLGGGDPVGAVEAAWRSGDELADTLAAHLEQVQEAPAALGSTAHKQHAVAA